ncbi:ATPase, T2SS/T4P/T4SS family [Cerasicoccus maritimus]|uniref:ATPase, T2SS/T4P/T4SS family n=1 Tax=Cerasicoccus maritimus TaxID=490089 RepID=UPI0028526012|nr:ATPase, T2SS/T4P/T4SS family [Cerasicoccus maritimus]
MSPTKIVQRLRDVHLFRELSDPELQSLAQACQLRSVEDSELIVEQGDDGDELHIILEGQFEVFLSQKTLGFEKQIGQLKEGDYFGEIALISGKKRSASVRASTSGKLLSLRRGAFLAQCEQSPKLSLKLCQALANYVQEGARQRSSVAFIKLGDAHPPKETLELIPPEVSKACDAMSIEHEGERVTIVMVDPDDAQKRNFLEQALQPLKPEFAATTADEMKKFVDRMQVQHGFRAKPPAEVALDFRGPDGQAIDISHNEAAKVLRDALREAIALKASDVHFEPKRGRLDVRARIDGRLLPLRNDVPVNLVRQVISMIKVLGNLDIAERRLPQDGNFVIQAEDLEIDTRLSLMPSQHGEKAVMRLLDPRAQLHYLNQIITSERVHALATELFTRAAGLTLVTGPTGSGKTTTLYAGLRSIWEDNRLLNIVSAEDPIDQRLDFATQTQILTQVGLTFPTVLRGLLRQDPDVILIGEIRDEHSASIALEAAITGHNVLSSLHTKHAAEAVARLRKLGAEPYLIAAALNGVIAQRLLPKLNPAAAQPVPIDDSELTRLIKIGVLDEPTDALRRGVSISPDQPAERGRVGLFEALAVDDSVRDAIESLATSQEMESRLNATNFVGMKRYARYLLLEQLVSPAAILGVFPESPEVGAL